MVSGAAYRKSRVSYTQVISVLLKYNYTINLALGYYKGNRKVNRKKLAILLTILCSAGSVAQDTEGRVFHPVSLADVGQTVHTHVEVQGQVLANHREADNDRHIILGDDSGHKLTVECIPEIPAILEQCAALKRGQQVRVQGISRIDRKHRWAEVHPVLRVQVIQ